MSLDLDVLGSFVPFGVQCCLESKLPSETSKDHKKVTKTGPLREKTFQDVKSPTHKVVDQDPSTNHTLFDAQPTSLSHVKYFLFESEGIGRQVSNVEGDHSAANRDQPKINGARSSSSSSSYRTQGYPFDILSSAMHQSEEEVVVFASTVTWSAGGVVRKSFTLETPIIQAIVVNFTYDQYLANHHLETTATHTRREKEASPWFHPAEPNDHHQEVSPRPYTSELCILHAEGIRVFSADSKTYSVVIPCGMERMWPLPVGLLLQRRLRSLSRPSGEKSPSHHLSLDFDHQDQFPMFYTLLHPLDEVKPLNFFDSLSTQFALKLCPHYINASPIIFNLEEKMEGGGHHSRTTSRMNSQADSFVQPLKTSGTIHSKHATASLQANDAHERDMARAILSDPAWEIVFTSINAPLFVLYHRISCRHSFWLFRKVDLNHSPANQIWPSANRSSPYQQSTTKNISSPISSLAGIYSWTSEKSSALPDASLDPSIDQSIFLEHSMISNNADHRMSRASLLIEHLYTEPEPTSQHPANGAFLLANHQAELVLCLLFSHCQQLRLYDIYQSNSTNWNNGETQPPKVKLLASIPCISAVPIDFFDTIYIQMAKRRIRLSPNWLCLTPANRIELYSLQEPVSHCKWKEMKKYVGEGRGPHHHNIHSPYGQDDSHIGSRSPFPIESSSSWPTVFSTSPNSPFPSDQTNSLSPPSALVQILFGGESSKVTKMVELCQPVTNRFNVRLADGLVFRLSLEFPIHSPLVIECLRTCASTLSHMLFNRLLANYFGWIGKIKKHQLDWNEWESFMVYIQFLASNAHSPSLSPFSSKHQSDKDPGIEINQDQGKKLGQEDKDQYWERMLDAAHRDLPRHSLLLHQYPLEDTHQPRLDKIFHPPPSLVSSWTRRGAHRILVPQLPQILHGLHLLAESCKLCCVRQEEARKITQLLYQVASHLKWEIYVDYYANALKLAEREQESSMNDCHLNLPNTTEMLQPYWITPPDIYLWLDQCLNGKPQTFPILSAPHPHSPCEILRKVARIYLILGIGEVDESQRSRMSKLHRHFEPFNVHSAQMDARLYKIAHVSPIQNMIAVTDRSSNGLPRLSQVPYWSPSTTTPSHSSLSRDDWSHNWKTRAQLAVMVLEEEFPNLQALDALEFGISLPLRHALYAERCEPRFNFSSYHQRRYEMTGREDLAWQWLPYPLLSSRILSNKSNHLEDQSSILKMPFSLVSTSGISDVKNYYHVASDTVPTESNLSTAASAHGGVQIQTAAEIDEELQKMNPTTLMLFSRDERLRHVVHLLDSIHAVRLSAPASMPTSSNDPDSLLEPLQRQLLAKLRRQFALSIGKGMFVLAANLQLGKVNHIIPRNLDPSNEIQLDLEGEINVENVSASVQLHLQAEPLEIPPLATTGVVRETKNILNLLDLSEYANETTWPQFHHGVAAGLRIAPVPYQRVSSAWILYNRPKITSLETHAGVLLALGLQGHLRQLELTAIYDYLSKAHALTSAALLLGYAACAYGTASSIVSKALWIHFPAAHASSTVLANSSSMATTSASALDAIAVAHAQRHSTTNGGGGGSINGSNNTSDAMLAEWHQLVQITSAMGLGLTFANTCNRHFAELFLSQVSAYHPELVNREGYALACGAALGFICLGQGNQLDGLSDLDVSSRLLSCIGRSSKPSAKHATRAQQRADASVAEKIRQPGGSTLWASHSQWFVSHGTCHLNSSSSTASNQHWMSASNEETLNNSDLVRLAGTHGPQVLLGPFNLAPVVSASTRSISNDTHHHLGQPSSWVIREVDAINPDVHAAGAIIALTLIWLKTHNNTMASCVAIPRAPFLLDYIRSDLQILRTLSQHLIMWDMIEPSQHWLDAQIKELKSACEHDDEAHRKTAQRSSICILTGSIMAIGIKYAGTQCRPAFDLLYNQVLKSIDQWKSQVKRSTIGHRLSNINQPAESSQLVELQADLHMLEMCTCQVILALTLVMAGTGNCRVLALCRRLRAFKSIHSVYGYHMAISMAIGFLFLGGGLFSLTTTNKAVAVLIISLYPLYPNQVNDNRYHAQLFRHLYVLAAQPRYLETRQIESLDPCYVPLKVHIQIPHHGVRKNTSEAHLGGLVKITGHSTRLPSEEFNSINYDDQKRAFTNRTLDLTTPCLLPPLEWIVAIEIHSPRYWKSALYPRTNLRHALTLSHQHYWLIKRKTGSLPYHIDSTMSCSLIAQAYPQIISSQLPINQLEIDDDVENDSDQDHPSSTNSASHYGIDSLLKLANASTSDERISAFCQYFMAETDPSQWAFANGVLSDCLQRDKPEMLQVYLKLYHLLSASQNEDHQHILRQGNHQEQVCNRKTMQYNSNEDIKHEIDWLNVKLIVTFCSQFVESAQHDSVSSIYSPMIARDLLYILQVVLLQQESIHVEKEKSEQEDGHVQRHREFKRWMRIKEFLKETPTLCQKFTPWHIIKMASD